MLDTTPSRSRIPGLDGLRGIAASLVLLSHMSNWGYDLFPGADLRGLGRSGVILFFVISAFLLSSQVLDWSPRLLLSSKRWASYFEARALRIWPLFLVVLVVSLITTYSQLIPIIWRASWLIKDLPVPMTLASLQEHLLLREGEDILWTIPVEFKFYLLLPLILVALLIPLRKRPKIAISVLAVGILAAHWLNPVIEGGVDTLPFIGVFLTGILLAFVLRHNNNSSSADRAHTARYEVLAWLCLTLYVFLIPAVYSALTGMTMPVPEEKANSLYATLWALMIIFMLSGSGIMRRILDSSLLIFLGMVSYSLYLWHRVPINLMHRLTYYHHIDFLPEGLRGVVVLVTTMGLAYLSYVVVERPVQRWRANRSHARKQGVGGPIAPHQSAIRSIANHPQQTLTISPTDRSESHTAPRSCDLP